MTGHLRIRYKVRHKEIKMERNNFQFINVFVDGQSQTLPVEELDLGDVFDEADLKLAVAGALSKDVPTFNSFVADPFEASGTVHLRPDGKFGK